MSGHDGDTGRETLYEDGEITLQRYQTGRYGLTVHALQVVFSTVRTPPATSIHEFLDGRGEQVGSIKRSGVPHEVTLELDETEESVGAETERGQSDE